MEEAAELAIPVMTSADGSQTLERARREIETERADVRINLQIISERIGISAEHSTSLKWAEIRDTHPNRERVVGSKRVSDRGELRGSRMSNNKEDIQRVYEQKTN